MSDPIATQLNTPVDLPELRGRFERILCVARSSGGPAIGHIQLADQLMRAVQAQQEASDA